MDAVKPQLYMSENYLLKDITLLITHFNRSNSLERLLKCLQELKLFFGEIIVSDDHSSHEHLELLINLQSQYNFRLINSAENMGLANNLNKGQECVETPYTLYIQEDFIPMPAFKECLKEAYNFMEVDLKLDIVRFYAYGRYPHLVPFKSGFSEMVYKPWSLKYRKLFYYSDHPHLRRSTFTKKFGIYKEGINSDKAEYRMCISFIQNGGKGLFYTDFQKLFHQDNSGNEPSTVTRSVLTISENSLIKLIRDLYRQLKYNFDLLFLKGKTERTHHVINLPRKMQLGSDTIFKPLLNKLFGLITVIEYRNVPEEFKQFYKDTYYCKLIQFKYFFRDYIFKSPYKNICYDGEFANELQFVLPFAYWHHKNGTLKKTSSSKLTSELYFFSENHEEQFDKRRNDGNYNFNIPRVLYSQDYNISKWQPVPLKDVYRNEIYCFEKPILIIANRYNMEWDDVPVSYFSKVFLAKMIIRLREKYTIIYNRPNAQNITDDENTRYELNEFDWLRKEYPEVILMEDLYKENITSVKNFNHLQFLVYANTNHFISTHGGTATLASYFGGVNTILSKKGPEHHFRCYEKLYPKLSGAKILHARTEEELQDYITSYYIN